jgi:hypothetical protein
MKINLDEKTGIVTLRAESQEEQNILLTIWESEGMQMAEMEVAPLKRNDFHLRRRNRKERRRNAKSAREAIRAIPMFVVWKNVWRFP